MFHIYFFPVTEKQRLSHYTTSPAAWLRIGVIRHIDFVLVAVDKEGPRLALPLVVDLGHRDDSDLVPLSQDLLLWELGGMAGHQLGRGHPDHLVIETLHREHALALLLIRHLAAGVTQEEVWQRVSEEPVRGETPPGDPELDEAQQLWGSLALGTVLGASTLYDLILVIISIKVILSCFTLHLEQSK